MPSKSPAQHRLMEGIAHGWKPDKLKSPPSKKVAQEFVKADVRVSDGKVKRTKRSVR